MGGLRDLNLKIKYNSDVDYILEDFYIPTLGNSVRYRRMAGFFSSTSLAVAAKGIQDFIKNHGRMELLCSARLTPSDVEAIEKQGASRSQVLEDRISKDISSIQSEFVKDHVTALAWMVSKNYLEIRIVFVEEANGSLLSYPGDLERAIFHPKVGILEDEFGSRISFSGSENETALGWTTHIEQFKVFRDWDESEKKYVESDIEDFDHFWKSEGHRSKTMLVSDAIRGKLLSLAPESEEELCLEKWTRGVHIPGVKRPKLRDIQIQARQKWTEAGRRGILEMATGTGKTIAALACMSQEFETNPSMLCVISTPYDHLVKQWQREIGRFGIDSNIVVADSSAHAWKDTVTDFLIDLKHGQIKQLIVLTTPNTLSSTDFMAIVEKSPTKKFVIVDEVHGIGAPQRQLGLLDEYELRLGLSATPRRWMDAEGTDAIFSYFGGTVFSFGLKEAIDTINPDTGETYLVPYYYYPKFVDLTSEEIEEYRESSEKIAKLYQIAKKDPQQYKRLEMEMIKRQDILNNAVAKYQLLEKLIGELKELPFCLVYCSPDQIDRVMQILDSKGHRPHRFTMDEGTTSRKEFGGHSEREEILKRFEQGIINPLVAIRCLDEGVDIKPARIGILMCSSGNEIQFIQRRGRLLRRSDGKSHAEIYDIIPVFRYGKIRQDKWRNEPGGYLVSHEYRRFREFAGIAKNSASCLKEITRLELGIV